MGPVSQARSDGEDGKVSVHMEKKLLVGAVAALLGAVTAVLLVFTVGIQQVRHVEQAIAQEVLQNGWLTTVTETAVYVGEKEYRVARGWDEQGQEKWIWFNEDERYETSTTGLLSAEDAIRTALQQYPDARIVNLTPGLYKQRPVWVVFLQENATKHYVYLYLQMTDGAVIRQLTLH